MTKKDAIRGTNAGTAGKKPVGPEIGAEKAERRRYEEARRQCRIISGVRTKIDADK
jgi:hypothetical protein